MYSLMSWISNFPLNKWKPSKTQMKVWHSKEKISHSVLTVLQNEISSIFINDFMWIFLDGILPFLNQF